jgi:hypothetical protein
MKLVYLEWFDASYQEGFLVEEDFTPQCILSSAGLFVREDDDTVTLAADFDPRCKEWRHISHIPKVNITRREILTVPEKL